MKFQQLNSFSNFSEINKERILQYNHSGIGEKNNNGGGSGKADGFCFSSGSGFSCGDTTCSGHTVDVRGKIGGHGFGSGDGFGNLLSGGCS